MTGGILRGVDLLMDTDSYAFDRVVDRELFKDVLSRRIIAFLIDLFILAVPIMLAALFLFLFVAFPLRTGWAGFWLLGALSVIWMLIYYGATIGGPASATMGMRAVGLEVRTWFGSRCYWELGAAHGMLFWVIASALTPLVLLFGLLNARHQLLHDFLLGTVVIKVS
jgi:uncharacterized RDD family membrane protein YckC